MIDLHLHTTYSDGTWNVEELLKNAEKLNVSPISITDHDTVEAHKYLNSFDYSTIYHGEIIHGAELNTVLNSYKFELLAYDFDIQKLDNWIEQAYTKEVDLMKEFEMLLAQCSKNNIKIDCNLDYDTSMGWPIDVIFNSIKKYPENKKLFSENEWNSSSVFFRSATCNTDFPLYMDFSYLYPDAKDVSNAIREAGGKVFLAHLFIYPIKNHIEFLDILREEQIIDGVEVYYPFFSEAQIKELESYCQKYNLYISAGTDCHGSRKPERMVGVGFGNMNVSEKIITNWHKNKNFSL